MNKFSWRQAYEYILLATGHEYILLMTAIVAGGNTDVPDGDKTVTAGTEPRYMLTRPTILAH
jgi:hypothetical protein